MRLQKPDAGASWRLEKANTWVPKKGYSERRARSLHLWGCLTYQWMVSWLMGLSGYPPGQPQGLPPHPALWCGRPEASAQIHLLQPGGGKRLRAGLEGAPGWFGQSSDFGSGRNLKALEFEPRTGFYADSSEAGVYFGFCVLVSLCPSPTDALFLSLKNNH